MTIMGRLMEMHLDAKHTLMFIKCTWCMQKFEQLIGIRLDTQSDLFYGLIELSHIFRTTKVIQYLMTYRILTLFAQCQGSKKASLLRPLSIKSIVFCKFNDPKLPLFYFRRWKVVGNCNICSLQIIFPWSFLNSCWIN